VKKLGDVLRDYLREKGWLEGNPYQPLFDSWADLAGEALSRHTRLVDVHDGILVVEVDHPGWMQMIQLRRESLLEAARRTAPLASITGMRVRVGPGPGGAVPNH
jgi:predicted nucleic acid-binding Zn ribbon protein